MNLTLYFFFITLAYELTDPDGFEAHQLVGQSGRDWDQLERLLSQCGMGYHQRAGRTTPKILRMLSQRVLPGYDNSFSFLATIFQRTSFHLPAPDENRKTQNVYSV